MQICELTTAGVGLGLVEVWHWTARSQLRQLTSFDPLLPTRSVPGKVEIDFHIALKAATSKLMSPGNKLCREPKS